MFATAASQGFRAKRSSDGGRPLTLAAVPATPGVPSVGRSESRSPTSPTTHLERVLLVLLLSVDEEGAILDLDDVAVDGDNALDEGLAARANGRGQRGR